jgi:hypothetical protein
MINRIISIIAAILLIASSASAETFGRTAEDGTTSGLGTGNVWINGPYTMSEDGTITD